MKNNDFNYIMVFYIFLIMKEPELTSRKLNIVKSDDTDEHKEVLNNNKNSYKKKNSLYLLC